MAGLVPIGQDSQNTNAHCITIEIESDGSQEQRQDALSSLSAPDTIIGRRKTILKGYEQCIGMILVFLISFSTLVALLKDVYEQGRDILTAQDGAMIAHDVNYTLLHNETIKAYFIN